METEVTPAVSPEVEVLDDDLLTLFQGPLDQVIGTLQSLRERYSNDYENLQVREWSCVELGGETLTSYQLVGVPNYSAATLEKIKQLKELIKEVPKEVLTSIYALL